MQSCFMWEESLIWVCSISVYTNAIIVQLCFGDSPWLWNDAPWLPFLLMSWAESLSKRLCATPQKGHPIIYLSTLLLGSIQATFQIWAINKNNANRSRNSLPISEGNWEDSPLGGGIRSQQAVGQGPPEDTQVNSALADSWEVLDGSRDLSRQPGWPRKVWWVWGSSFSQPVWKSPCTLATSIVLLVRFIQYWRCFCVSIPILGVHDWGHFQF